MLANVHVAIKRYTEQFQRSDFSTAAKERGGGGIDKELRWMEVIMACDFEFMMARTGCAFSKYIIHDNIVFCFKLYGLTLFHIRFS